jgi:hypothetical protein
MKTYQCIRRFFCQPLKRYIPTGALLARYENATRIVIQDAPQSDQNIYNILVDGIVYENPTDVAWFYSVEPPNTVGLFVLLATKDEDAYGNVSGTADGLPSTSQFRVRVSDGQPFMKSVTNGLWYPIRLVGTDGSVTLQIGQTGEVSP